MSTEHPLLAEWRAKGHEHKLTRYAEAQVRAAKSHQRIIQLIESVLDEVEGMSQLAASERARIVALVQQALRGIRTADLSPHPANVDAQIVRGER